MRHLLHVNLLKTYKFYHHGWPNGTVFQSLLYQPRICICIIEQLLITDQFTCIMCVLLLLTKYTYNCNIFLYKNDIYGMFHVCEQLRHIHAEHAVTNNGYDVRLLVPSLYDATIWTTKVYNMHKLMEVLIYS